MPQLVETPPDSHSGQKEVGFSETSVRGMPTEGPKLLVRARFPTALAISHKRQLFFAEREGRIWMIDLSDTIEKTDSSVQLIAEIPVSTEGERGLLGLALHPDFDNQPYLYAFASPAANEEIGAVHRLQLDGGSVVKDDVIIELFSGSGCCHKGGRLAFGPDGKMYVTLGDGLVPPAAADMRDLRGKILRYEADGSLPSDGAFGAHNPVWATGLRNSFGIAFGLSGDAFATDNGPSGGDGPRCCDEVNRVQAGGHYGWPNSYGSRYQEGTPPIWHSGEGVIVPTGITIVSSPRFGLLEGAVAFCSFAQHRMFVIDKDGREWAAGLEQPGKGPEGCGLDITQGPDGRLYFSDTDAIYVWG